MESAQGDAGFGVDVTTVRTNIHTLKKRDYLSLEKVYNPIVNSTHSLYKNYRYLTVSTSIKVDDDVLIRKERRTLFLSMNPPYYLYFICQLIRYILRLGGGVNDINDKKKSVCPQNETTGQEPRVGSG